MEKITFQSARLKLRKFGCEGCYNLLEIQGLLKLVALENLDEADLGHLKWIKEYESHSVQMVGDDLAPRSMHTQVITLSNALQKHKRRHLYVYILPAYVSSNMYLTGYLCNSCVIGVV